MSASQETSLCRQTETENNHRLSFLLFYDSCSAYSDTFISHRADMPSEVYKRSERMENSRCEWGISFNAFAGKLSFIDLKRRKFPFRFYEFLKLTLIVLMWRIG